MDKRRTKRGFTLVELIVVLVNSGVAGRVAGARTDRVY